MTDIRLTTEILIKESILALSNKKKEYYRNMKHTIKIVGIVYVGLFMPISKEQEWLEIKDAYKF